MRSTLFVPLFLSAALLTGALAGCGGGGGSAPASPPLAVAPLGTLGARNMQLQVTTTGALLTMPCGQSGEITQPITLDAAGHFDVAGTLTPIQGAPLPLPRPSSVPARFVGTTDGKTMTLTVTPAPLGAPATGAYTLTYGAPAVTDIGACPF